jgi:hypothetical protein
LTRFEALLESEGWQIILQFLRQIALKLTTNSKNISVSKKEPWMTIPFLALLQILVRKIETNSMESYNFGRFGTFLSAVAPV